MNAFCEKLEKNVEPNLDAATYTTPIELKAIIRRLKTSKAPGIDGIQNILLKKLPLQAIVLLTKTINGCIKIGYFPTAFKCAKVLPIPKPGKDPKLPTSYRPISLLSSLGKVLERVILARLNAFTERENVLASEQFGFRPEHSTVHQVKRVTNIINTNKARRLSTGALFLDIEKAFDSIWHRGLIYKLNSFGSPTYLTKLISSFVSNRKFFVTVSGSPSSTRDIAAGVPQGSVLSPTLYSLFISDYKKPKNCEIAYYADDTSLLVKGKLTKAIIKRLQSSINSCQKYLKKWRIQLNYGKTQAIIFPFNKSPKRIPTTKLKFGNTEIDFLDEAKYLGVILDKKLNYAKHIQCARRKAQNCTKALYPLLARNSKLTIQNKNLLYKMVVRPTLTYASPIWSQAAKTHIKSLQVIQNKCLKLINNLSWDFRTVELHQITRYPKIEEIINTFTNKFDDKCRISEHELIRGLPNE